MEILSKTNAQQWYLSNSVHEKNKQFSKFQPLPKQDMILSAVETSVLSKVVTGLTTGTIPGGKAACCGAFSWAEEMNKMCYRPPIRIDMTVASG